MLRVWDIRQAIGSGKVGVYSAYRDVTFVLKPTRPSRVGEARTCFSLSKLRKCWFRITQRQRSILDQSLLR